METTTEISDLNSPGVSAGCKEKKYNGSLWILVDWKFKVAQNRNTQVKKTKQKQTVLAITLTVI